MSDATKAPPAAPESADRSATGVGVLAVYTDEDGDVVRPAVEAVRERGFVVQPVSESDPAVWGRDPAGVLAEFPARQYPVAVAFLSDALARSGFYRRVLETLVGDAPPYRLPLPVRLDDAPPPAPFDRTASVDLRKLSPDVFADRVRDAVAKWTAADGAAQPPVTAGEYADPGPWYRAAFVLGLETDRRTQDGLRALAETLPESDRDLFRMKFLDGWDDRQIAARIDIPREVVPIRIDRLLSRIRERFPRAY